MTAHTFGVGQRVRLSPGGFDGDARRGIYVVVRRMPSETRDLRCRGKDVRDGRERVVRESQLGQV